MPHLTSEDTLTAAQHLALKISQVKSLKAHIKAEQTRQARHTQSVGQWLEDVGLDLRRPLGQWRAL